MVASTDKTPQERLQELLDEECDCPAFALDTNLGDRCAELLRLTESELPGLLARERELTEALERHRRFVQYVREGNVGHISGEGIEWANALLAGESYDDGDALAVLNSEEPK